MTWEGCDALPMSGMGLATASAEEQKQISLYARDDNAKSGERLDPGLRRGDGKAAATAKAGPSLRSG